MEKAIEASHKDRQEPPVRVLVIEDCEDLAELTAELLNGEGLDARIALSGHEALEVASTFRPQLVLCDLNLPDMNGLDVARELRSSSSTGRSYIVILTAMQRTDLADRGAESIGIDAVLSKPITIAALDQMLEEIGRKGRRVIDRSVA
jgi:CheY-like chemotaxis protein